MIVPLFKICYLIPMYHYYLKKCPMPAHLRAAVDREGHKFHRLLSSGYQFYLSQLT